MVASGATNQMDGDGARLRSILAARGLVPRPWHRIDWLASTDSTNRVLADALRSGEPPGRVLVADHQSLGRGRLGRTWEAPPRSALLMSFSLPAPAADVLGLVPLAVGMGAMDALAGVPGVGLKWPNDLMVGARKLSGILCEGVSGSGVVCGIGLNQARPAVVEGVLAERAVWVDELADAPDPAVLAADVLAGAQRWIELAWSSPESFVAAYGARSATVGRDVRVELADGALVGRAAGIRRDGALVVAPVGGGHDVAVTAGDVVHLRPAG